MIVEDTTDGVAPQWSRPVKGGATFEMWDFWGDEFTASMEPPG